MVDSTSSSVVTIALISLLGFSILTFAVTVPVLSPSLTVSVTVYVFSLE